MQTIALSSLTRLSLIVDALLDHLILATVPVMNRLSIQYQYKASLAMTRRMHDQKDHGLKHLHVFYHVHAIDGTWGPTYHTREDSSTRVMVFLEK
jgi:hypothetical protein